MYILPSSVSKKLPPSVVQGETSEVGEPMPRRAPKTAVVVSVIVVVTFVATVAVKGKHETF